MNRTHVVSTFFILIFFFNNTFSQTEKELQPLTNIFKTIEARFNVSFNYADANVSNVKILTPEVSTLRETLNYLRRETHLKYNALPNGNIIVSKAKPIKRSKSTRLQILDEVVVTNYLTKGISKPNDGTIVLKPSEFNILPGLIEPDVLQTIQALPGIQSTDETVSNLNIRGGTHDQNLILWEGIKMYQSGHFFGLISAFNPYLTKNVTVIKNGTSAFYGDGVSSIIDMRSKHKIDNELSGGFGTNLIHADAFAIVPISQKTEIQLSARRSITDAINTPTFEEYFKRISQDSDLNNSQNTIINTDADFYFYDASLKLLHDFSKDDKLRINVLTIFNDLAYKETATNNFSDEALNSGLSQFNISGSVFYEKQWNPDFTTDIQLYISQYDLDATNFDVINNQRLIQENKVTDVGLKINSHYNFSDAFKWRNGYQFIEVGISNLQDVNNPLFRSLIKEVVRTHSAYTEGYYKSSNGNTNIKLGIRGNYIDKFNKLLIEPRLSLSQNILNNLKFEVLGEFKSQTTSQIIDRQNDFLGIEKRRWVLSNNNNIPIIQSKQISTGLHYYKNRLRINLEAYIKQVDGITTRSQGFQNQFQFVNAIGSYQVKGIDVLINKQFNNASTWLSYSYSKNDYNFNTLNNGNAFPNNVDTRHAVAFASTYNFNDKLQIGLGFNWRSGIPTTNPILGNQSTNGSINYELPNASNIKDYFRADASVTYNFALSRTLKAKAGLSFWNVTNQKNIINTYYTINEQETILQVNNQSLGITPNVSFRVSF